MMGNTECDALRERVTKLAAAIGGGSLTRRTRKDEERWAEELWSIANALAALRDEVERLRDSRRKWVSMSAEFEHRAEAAEAENERLREALQPFAAFPLEDSLKFTRREAAITGFNDWTLRVGHIMDARALLNTEGRSNPEPTDEQ